MSNSVLLHVHDAYSVRDSCLKTEDLVKRVADYKYPAVCVTNHGNGHSWFKLYKEAKKYGIKPIIGIEFYYADDATDKGENYHLCAYAKNEQGYKNLCKLSSWSYINGFYRRPRVDKKILEECKEGLIISSACCFSKSAQLIINNQIDEAVAEIQDFVRIFGDDYYLEVMNHNIADEDIVRNWYRNYGKENNIKVIGTTDTHYENADDQKFHGIFKNISYASGGEKDSSFEGTRFHVWTPTEMAQFFDQNELDNTLEIAEKCNVEFKFKGYHLPEYSIPDPDMDTHEYLVHLCNIGMKEKGFSGNKTYEERLQYELGMLHMADLENYILIVSDYCKWCKSNGIIIGPGRGSFAGSLVSYLTDITSVDPIKYGLLFGRAVNTGRVLQYDFGV